MPPLHESGTESATAWATSPSGALDADDARAVILLRPGEPLDVRKLYVEESDTNAKCAHAPTRTTLEIAAESEVPAGLEGSTSCARSTAKALPMLTSQQKWQTILQPANG